MHNWDLDQSWLTGIDTQHLFPTVSFFDWLVATNRRSVTLLYKHRIHLYRTDWKIRWFLVDEHTKSLCSPSVPISFPQMHFFPSVLPKRVYQVPLRMYSKSSQRKPAKHKKHHVTKFQNKVRLLSLKRITWKQRRDVLDPIKGYNS